MKAALVLAPGQTPVYGDFADPAPDTGERRISVTAAALSHLTRGRAAGTHYSADGKFPFVAGIDGVGQADDGQRVYFAVPRAPYGGMAQTTVVAPTHCVAVPDDLDDVTAAAIANPGMSSWAAFGERARLQPGETVLVNGATGTAGRLAVQIARYLGAKKVIVTGRNTETLKSLECLGADVTISLTEDDQGLEASFAKQFAEGVDVVIDYLWGKSAECLLSAGAKAGDARSAIRFVQVGSSSGRDIILPSAVLRAAPIELMGSGIGSVPVSGLINAIGEVLRAATRGGFKIATRTVPLSQVEAAWHEDDGARRTVFIPDAHG